jgi:hypothetical protein
MSAGMPEILSGFQINKERKMGKQFFKAHLTGALFSGWYSLDGEGLKGFVVVVDCGYF